MQPIVLIRRVVGDAIAALVGDILPPLPPRPVPYRSRPGGLGPNQLQWCRDNIPSFAACERQAVLSQKGMTNGK